MTKTNPTSIPQPFAQAIERFVLTQEGRNRSRQTIKAYRSDLGQLAAWLHEDNSLLEDPAEVTTDDLNRKGFPAEPRAWITLRSR